jgi:flagellar protein FlaG
MAVMSTDSLSIEVNKAWQQAEAPVRPKADGRSAVVEAVPKPPVAEVLKVDAAVEQINAALQDARRDLRFNVDDELGRVIVQVVQQSTGEVVRQIPSEEALAIAQQLRVDGSLNSLGVRQWS